MATAFIKQWNVTNRTRQAPVTAITSLRPMEELVNHIVVVEFKVKYID